MSIIKPNTPMISQGQEFYPLTHASQIIKSDGTRLEQDGKIIVDGAGSSLTPESDIIVNSVDAQKYQLDGLDITRTFEPTVPFGESIPENADLNDIKYLAIGNYFCSSGAISATLTNNPTEYAFLLTVLSPISKGIDNENDTWRYRVRKILDHMGHQYIQHCHTEGTAGEWIFGEWEQILTSGSTLPLTGGTIDDNITVTSDTTTRYFSCDVGSYDIRLLANTAGNRGIYDNVTGTWLLKKDADNNVTLNGTATKANAVAATAVKIRSCSQWSGEIAKGSYSSTISITPTAISGYRFLGPVGWGSNSSYVSVYGLYYHNSQIRFYIRNLNENSAITPSIDLYGLYTKI